VKAFVSIKYHADSRNRERIEGISAALEKSGFVTVCIVRDVERWGEVRYTPRELMSRTFAEIDSCDIVVVDLTEKGVGVGIEAGCAYARAKRIVTIAEQGADISTTLRGISDRVLVYERVGDLERLFAQV
jgi:nucleoside 2-deoxyribosyltransferase